MIIFIFEKNLSEGIQVNQPFLKIYWQNLGPALTLQPSGFIRDVIQEGLLLKELSEP